MAVLKLELWKYKHFSIWTSNEYLNPDKHTDRKNYFWKWCISTILTRVANLLRIPGFSRNLSPNFESLQICRLMGTHTILNIIRLTTHLHLFYSFLIIIFTGKSTFLRLLKRGECGVPRWSGITGWWADGSLERTERDPNTIFLQILKVYKFLV